MVPIGVLFKSTKRRLRKESNARQTLLFLRLTRYGIFHPSSLSLFLSLFAVGQKMNEQDFEGNFNGDRLPSLSLSLSPQRIGRERDERATCSLHTHGTLSLLGSNCPVPIRKIFVSECVWISDQQRDEPL